MRGKAGMTWNSELCFIYLIACLPAYLFDSFNLWVVVVVGGSGCLCSGW